MLYGIIGRDFWATGHVGVLGTGRPFYIYGVYPFLVGLPIHLLGPAAGVVAIQVVQAIVVSLTAAVVWAWTRALVGARWALVAAILTACLPALAYSGLLMTEAVFLPAGTLALWLMARALARPTLPNQALLVGGIVLATAARLQGTILIPVVLTAAVLAAWFGRDARLLVRLAPTWIAILGLGLLWVGVQLVAYGTLENGLGAYGVAATAGYEPAEAGRWVLRHAGDLFLLVVGVPLLATGVLAYVSARGREPDPAVRALVGVTVATSLWLTIQVGVFASRYVGQLAERDLIIVAPVLIACFVTWLARGLPRPQPATSIIALAVAVPAVLLPVRDLATPAAVPDAFMTVPLARFMAATSASAASVSWALCAAALIGFAVIVPRRAAAALPILVGVALLGASALASSEVAGLTRVDREAFFGTAAETWVDDAASGPVAYLYEGGAFWNGVSKTAFWNSRIRRVVAFGGVDSGPIGAGIVTPQSDGRLVDPNGRPLEADEIVASTALTVDGELVAEIAQTNLDQRGLRLWRTDGTPRISMWTTGLNPDGDIVRPVRVVVYACGPGRLELTLLGKQGLPVEVDVDGRPALRLTVPPGTVWNGSVRAPASVDGDGRCTFDIRSGGLVGSTRIAFVRV